MPKKKKKKLIILIVIISILLVLLITGGVCAYLYINTYMLKSNQTLFEKYLAQNISMAKEFIDRNPEEMLDILERNKYTSNMTIKAVFTNGIGTTDENKNNTINNASLNINSQVDKANNYNYKNIRLAYETQDLAKMEYIQSDNQKGIRLDGIKEFVTIKSDDLQKASENMGIEKQNLESLWMITQGLDLKEILNFSNDEIQKLEETYSKIIEENTSKESFGKIKDSSISINDAQTVADGYYIELTKEQYYSLLIKILEQLTSDEIILGKIDNFENLAKQYGINSDKSYRETFQEYINKNIEEIKGKNIGNEKFKVSVYEQNGQLIKTTIETDEGSFTIDIYNDKKSIKIDKIDTTQTEQQRQIISINQDINNSLEDLSLEYTNYENGVEQMNLALSSKREMQNSDIKGNYGISYELDNCKIELTGEEYIKVVNNFEEPVELNEENNVSINNLNQEQTQTITGILQQNAQDKLNTITEKITSDDINSMLKSLGFIKEDVIKTEEPIEVTETERNRFNSSLTLFIGEERTVDDVKRLLETVQTDFSDATITNDDKDKLQEITLEIERGKSNTEKKDEVLAVLDENKSKKFNITMSYDEETKLINRIFLKIPET